MTSLRAQTKPVAAAPALHLYVNRPAAGMLAGSHMAMPAARRGRTGTGTSPAAKHIHPHSCPGPTICPRLLIHPAHLPGPSSANGQAKPPAPYWRGGTSSAPLQQGEAGRAPLPHTGQLSAEPCTLQPAPPPHGASATAPQGSPGRCVCGGGVRSPGGCSAPLPRCLARQRAGSQPSLPAQPGRGFGPSTARQHCAGFLPAPAAKTLPAAGLC